MLRDESLLEDQRRFLAALREPIFGESRARTELPARDGDVSAAFTATADALISPSATLASALRLELYHRQYWYRLVDSLAEDFPALRALLGDDGFFALVEAYLEAESPRSFSLLEAGHGLAAFIEAQPALAARPIHAMELAALESARIESANAAALPTPRPADLMGALALQPHARLLALRTRADVFWRRVDEGRCVRVEEGTAEPSRFLLVHREGLDVHVRELEPAAYALLAAIARHGRLQGAFGACVQSGALDPVRHAPEVERWFWAWTRMGILTTRRAARARRPERNAR